ncbi:MAG: F0F1 ATP synthase subunit epsilon [Sphingobacteriales bacterium 50-39]|nr:F0F1 ATP synthase subunit epsilon [Sphingobacteriales bacterium]OJW56464.1 MAG: F0F1 ATP synthase subunit epsilon [Sphingobacteriales bacterium 50-39]
MIASINLSILLPDRAFLHEDGVRSVVAEGGQGSWGLLPNRLDCVLIVRPGILTYRDKDGRERFVAIDEGVLVKTGADILLSVRHAVDGPDLGQLRQRVEQEFQRLDEEDVEMRSMIYKVESGFIRRLLKMRQS